MAQETMTEKAQRLIDERRVTPIAVQKFAGVYAVKGDTKPYLVTVLPEYQRAAAQRAGAEPATCGCEARGVCSHILAADAMFRHSQAE